MLVLSILHSIFLSEEEIQKLKQNLDVETIGVSLPIWSSSSTTSTSEPAEEVFCTYILKNDKNKDQNIKFSNNGYVIYLPNIPDDSNYKDLTIEQINNMSYSNIQEWYNKNPHYPSILDLENNSKIRQNCLEFKHIFKTRNLNKTKIIRHKVIIMPDKNLLDSIS